METTQVFDWYLPMMFHLKTLKMTKSFLNTQNLIQKFKSLYNNFKDKRKIKWTESLYDPFSPEERNYECV